MTVTIATKRPARFKLPARIRNKRNPPAEFAARMTLIDRIADLPGIETGERDDDISPRRVEVYLRRESSDRVLKRRPALLLCGLDRDGVFVSGLSRWERHQVLANGWGKLVGDQVCVHMPRDYGELEIVSRIIRRAYDRLLGPSMPEAGSMMVSTWDRPGSTQTSLH